MTVTAGDAGMCLDSAGLVSRSEVLPGSDTLPGSTSLRRTNPALSRHKPSVTSGQSWRFCFECPNSPGALWAAPVNQVLVRSYSTTVHECANNSHCRSYRAVSMALRFRSSTSAARYNRPRRNCVGGTPMRSHNALSWLSHRGTSPVHWPDAACARQSARAPVCAGADRCPAIQEATRMPSKSNA